MHVKAGIDPQFVTKLQTMVREEMSVAHALRALHEELPPVQQRKITLLEYAKTAFGLSLSETAPIAGWEVDGTGEVTDGRLDDLVMPAIANRRPDWDAE